MRARGASQNAATSLSNFASGVDSIASRVPGAVAELKDACQGVL